MKNNNIINNLSLIAYHLPQINTSIQNMLNHVRLRPGLPRFCWLRNWPYKTSGPRQLLLLSRSLLGLRIYILYVCTSIYRYSVHIVIVSYWWISDDFCFLLTLVVLCCISCVWDIDAYDALANSTKLWEIDEGHGLTWDFGSSSTWTWHLWFRALEPWSLANAPGLCHKRPCKERTKMRKTMTIHLPIWLNDCDNR